MQFTILTSIVGLEAQYTCDICKHLYILGEIKAAKTKHDNQHVINHQLEHTSKI